MEDHTTESDAIKAGLQAQIDDETKKLQDLTDEKNKLDLEYQAIHTKIGELKNKLTEMKAEYEIELQTTLEEHAAALKTITQEKE